MGASATAGLVTEIEKEGEGKLLSSIDKFIVAAAGLVVALGLLDEGTAQDVVGVLTAVAVYLVPNK